MTKNVFVLMLVASLTFLAACGGDSEDQPAGDNLLPNSEVNSDQEEDGQPDDEQEGQDNEADSEEDND